MLGSYPLAMKYLTVSTEPQEEAQKKYDLIVRHHSFRNLRCHFGVVPDCPPSMQCLKVLIMLLQVHKKKIVYHEDQENYMFNHYVLPDMFLFNCQLKWILVIIVTIACREYIICKVLTPKYLRLMYAVQSYQRENIQAFIHYVYKENKQCYIYGLSETQPKLNQGQIINMFQGIST